MMNTRWVEKISEATDISQDRRPTCEIANDGQFLLCLW